jgi:hypothetical protein
LAETKGLADAAEESVLGAAVWAGAREVRPQTMRRNVALRRKEVGENLPMIDLYF